MAKLKNLKTVYDLVKVATDMKMDASMSNFKLSGMSKFGTFVPENPYKTLFITSSVDGEIEKHYFEEQFKEVIGSIISDLTLGHFEDFDESPSVDKFDFNLKMEQPSPTHPHPEGGLFMGMGMPGFGFGGGFGMPGGGLGGNPPFGAPLFGARPPMMNQPFPEIRVSLEPVAFVDCAMGIIIDLGGNVEWSFENVLKFINRIHPIQRSNFRVWDIIETMLFGNHGIARSNFEKFVREMAAIAEVSDYKIKSTLGNVPPTGESKLPTEPEVEDKPKFGLNIEGGDA